MNPSDRHSQHSDASELDFIESLDDLNLEIVSSSAPVKNAREADLPSIDDITFSSSFTPETRKRIVDGWYAQILGQELGPFPFEELIDLVADEEISPTDFIRNGHDGDWMVAGEIEGLFPEVVETDDEDEDFELGADVELRDATPAADKLKVVGGSINSVVRESQKARNKPQTQQEVLEEPELQEVAEPEPELTAEEKEAARKAEIAARLGSWLDEQVVSPVEEPDVTVQEKTTEKAVLATAKATTPPPSPPPEPTMNSWEAQAPAAPPQVRPAAPPKPKIKSGGGESIFSKLGGMFGGMSAPSVSVDPKIFAVIGAVAVVFALIYLPSMIGGTNDNKILERFRGIYSELKQNQDNPTAISSMKSILPEIEETVQQLIDDGAGAKKPVKQRLMWIGKHCFIPMIQNPGTIKDPAKMEQMDDHFKTIQGLLGETVPTSSSPTSADEGSESESGEDSSE